ncbi:hypothetical protein QYE76_025720 [Lolium multiflorum]|uniref:Uncharacterized protein n=1 Tax=Lolium multiflorum TaxID=4521 RepID=A0AAD8RJ50_LOLMU|nr:hypothetical protein QYE76_025720 [Lolium multiflorum]
MVKKKNPSAAASSTSGGAAAKPSSILPKEGAPSAPPPAPAPPAPPSSAAKPGDWTASTVTKRDEKRSRSLGLISSDEGNVIFPASEDLHNLPNDASEGRGSSEPVDSRTVEHTSPSSEHDDPIDSETAHANLPPSAGDTCDTEGSVRNDDADHVMMLLLSLHLRGSDLMLSRQPPQLPKLRLLRRLLWRKHRLPPPFPKGKMLLLLRSSSFCVISSLEAFASQFTSLEADKIRLQEEAKSSSSKLEGAIKKAAVARQEVDSLKEELNKLKERLKEEEARAAEKDELLRQSALALLEAANIPATALDKIPSNSPANGVSTVLTAHQLTRGLLDKGKGALARMHSMIFPKATQEKTLGQLIDAFAVDTKEVIEFLEKEKLKSNGSNFTDWFRHVRIFLNGGNLQYVLDAPLGDPPAETETDEVKNVYATRKTRYSQVQCAILCSLEADLQKRFEHHDPHELINELKTIFETHAAVECYEASKHFFSCMMEEGSSVSEHMLAMTGHAKKLSDLGIVIPNRLGINRVLQSLPPSYKNFVMNYNMQNMNKELPELFAMLKSAEIEIKKEHQVLMVNKTTSFKQGKSKGKNKKSGKKAPRLL